MVSDAPLTTDVPQFRPTEVAKLADLILDWLARQLKGSDIDLVVNGKFIPLNPFARGIVTSTIFGLVSSLKGAEEIKDIYIALRRSG